MIFKNKTTKHKKMNIALVPNLDIAVHGAFEEAIASETIHEIGSVAGVVLGGKKSVHIVGYCILNIFGNIIDSTHQPFSFFLSFTD